MAKKILITGASGLVGSRLTEMLLNRGHEVSHVGRRRRAGKVPSVTWDVSAGTIEPGAIESVDTIIHLAGAGVADKRWTPDRKKELLDSRVKSIDLLYHELKKGNHSVKSFISASAIGFYGAGNEKEVFVETHPAGTDFLAQLTKQWEEASEKIDALTIRVAKLRIGIVLSEKGGALKSMAQPVKMGFGSSLGSGNQYLSWVHLDDLCRAFVQAAEEEAFRGVYNVAGVQPVTNRDMTRAIAKVLGKPLWAPAVPEFVLKLLLGEMAMIVTTGAKVSSDKIQQAGYKFQYTELGSALKELFNTKTQSY